MTDGTQATESVKERIKKLKAELEYELFGGYNDKCLPEIDVSSSAIYRTVAHDTRIDKYLTGTRLYDTVTKRWINILETASEAELSESFTEIFNDILQDSHVPGVSARNINRDFQPELEDSKDAGVNATIFPDIWIAGTGSKLKAAIPDEGPDYCECIAPVKVSQEALVEKVGLREVALQIGVYVRQCFVYQPNRRFVCAIVVTESRFRLMVFDRSGGIQTGSFDIHQEPIAFVRIILGIASIQDKDMSCFDDAIHWLPPTSDSTQRLRLRLTNCMEVATDDSRRQTLDIFLSDNPFATRSICGRGTRCWRGVMKGAGVSTVVVVKDSWRSKELEPEWDLLKRVTTFDGVGKLLFYCDDKENTISRFRSLIFGDTLSLDFDRTFSRLILEAYGPPIHYFETPLQLLQALRDAVAGHKFMWEIGILHRDISIHNILLGKENATEGNRGVLIDLDMAIDIKKYKKNAESRTGTRAFQSIMVVSPFVPGEIRPPQDHLDDLESFFYVLIWICILFVAPKNMTTSTRCSDANNMGNPVDRECVNAKAFLLARPTRSFSRWFYINSTFCALAKALGEWFEGVVEEKEAVRKAYRRTQTGQFPTLEQVHETVGTRDHDIFLGHLDNAIADLHSDLSAGPDPLRYLQYNEPFVPLDPPSGAYNADIYVYDGSDALPASCNVNTCIRIRSGD